MRGKISKIIARKTGVDWAIFGGVTLVLAGFLVYVTHLTPYRPPVQTIYTTAPSNATSFQRARIVSDAINGTLSAAVVDGAQAGETVTVLISPLATDNVSPGDAILITKNPTANTQNQTFSYIDRWRLPALGVLLAFFVLLVTLVGGRRGVASIIGLLVSVLIVGWFMIPNIIQGGNVIITTIISAYIIAIVSILIAHGCRKRTFISIACICVILAGIMLIAGLATWLTALSGIADELVFYLAKDNQWLDMRGLIISGIIIASLVNIFLASSALAFAISIIGVIVFVGLTAWDTQRIKADYIEYSYAEGTDEAAKRSVMDALALYLNFVNLFQLMLQFMGVRNQD